MPSVEGFKGEFRELARSNRFEMSGDACPPRPKLCTNVQVPAVSVATLEHRDGMNSVPWKIPYDVILAEATLTFRENENFENRDFFEDWFMDVATDRGFGYFDEFKKNRLIIEQKDRGGGTIYKWELTDLYPISLSEIQYSNESQNELTTWSVTLSYHNADWIG